jgi:nitronate monooxygenase
MTLPHAFRGAMRLPAIAAPMFLVSGPELVTETCKAGVAGTFRPSTHAPRPSSMPGWAASTQGWPRPRLRILPPPSALRHQPHPARLQRPRGAGPGTDLPPPSALRHHQPGPSGRRGEGRPCLRRAGVLGRHPRLPRPQGRIDAGVDGIIAVAGGAGGHAGTQSAFSLVREIREFWDGALMLGGAISDGYAVRAAEVLGADLAYMGTRFIATRESNAQDAYKQMLVDAARRTSSIPTRSPAPMPTSCGRAWRSSAISAKSWCRGSARASSRPWPTKPRHGVMCGAPATGWPPSTMFRRYASCASASPPSTGRPAPYPPARQWPESDGRLRVKELSTCRRRQVLQAGVVP